MLYSFVCTSESGHAFSFFLSNYLPSRIVRLCGKCIFNFIRNWQTVFQNVCIILCHCNMRIPVIPQPNKHLIKSALLLEIMSFFTLLLSKTENDSGVLYWLRHLFEKHTHTQTHIYELPCFKKVSIDIFIKHVHQ